MSTPLVRMLCHRGPVSALAVDPEGRYMASSGLDGRLKVWDLRTYKMVHSYALRTPATAIDISQRGLMGVACCGRVQIWKDALAIKASAPYLEHSLPAGAQVRERVQHSASACALLIIPTPFCLDRHIACNFDRSKIPWSLATPGVSARSWYPALASRTMTLSRRTHSSRGSSGVRPRWHLSWTNSRPKLSRSRPLLARSIARCVRVRPPTQTPLETHTPVPTLHLPAARSPRSF